MSLPEPPGAKALRESIARMTPQELERAWRMAQLLIRREAEAMLQGPLAELVAENRRRRREGEAD